MNRSLLTIMTGALLSGLSCAVVAPVPDVLDATELPHVSASAQPTERDRDIATVERYLLTRRTGLAGGEIKTLARAIVEESHRFDMDPTLVMAVMHVESRFNSFAVSPVGALGLMQILPATGEELAGKHGVDWHGARTLFIPEVNVKLGVAYLRELSNRYGGNIGTALAAYNWGPGRIDRRIRGGVGVPVEYTRLVLNAHATRRPLGRKS